jgi:uncharacterized coiled-coil protein SlyX
MGELENRLLSLEAGSPMPYRQPGPESGQIDVLDRTSLDQTSLRMRGELRDWLEESVTVRMAEVETRLRTESERGQKQMLDAFAESVQTRVMHRISRLEEEVAGQSAAMNELRECSLRTEQSVHKLLGGLDRLIVKNPPAAAEAPIAEKAGAAVTPAPAAAPEPAPVIQPPAFETRPKSSRWKFFG